MLTHVDADGQPTMVDVSEKTATAREATAITRILLPEAVLAQLDAGDIKTKKGPVLATAIIAGTMAVKRTFELIPFCHPIPIDSIKFGSRFEGPVLELSCTVRNFAKTGIEMEAPTGVSVAALTVYDMCKALSHDIVIAETRLTHKSGGKSDVHVTRA